MISLVIIWKWKLLSCIQLFANPWTVARQALSMEFSRQEFWSGYHALFQRSNPNLPHCKQTLYHSSYSGGRLLYDTTQRYDLIFTAFPTLSLSCPWLNYFVTGSLCLLTFLTYFSIPPGQDFLKLNTINRFVHTRAVLAMTDWAMIQPS